MNSTFGNAAKVTPKQCLSDEGVTVVVTVVVAVAVVVVLEFLLNTILCELKSSSTHLLGHFIHLTSTNVP